MSMLGRIFGKSKQQQQQQTDVLDTMEKLTTTLEMLEKKEGVLQKKVAAEVEMAKKHTKAKNKRAALQCLKRKRLYEQQVEQLGNYQLRIHDQMIMLESVSATTQTVDVLRSGAAVMKAMQKETNIVRVDKIMDDIDEQMENMKSIQEALASPVGAAADFDEDELEAELLELEDKVLIVEPVYDMPVRPMRVPSSKTPPRPIRHRIPSEDDELAELQKEMAI